MQEIINPDPEPVYFIAHDGVSTFHYGKIWKEQVLSTGQPNLEQFTTEQECRDRLATFGITPEDDFFSDL